VLPRRAGVNPSCLHARCVFFFLPLRRFVAPHASGAGRLPLFLAILALRMGRDGGRPREREPGAVRRSATNARTPAAVGTVRVGAFHGSSLMER
jgi:hypothetical protein